MDIETLTGLARCHQGTQEFFRRVEKILEEHWFYNLGGLEIAERLGIPGHVIGRYIKELNAKGILRVNRHGEHYCPFIIRFTIKRAAQKMHRL